MLSFSLVPIWNFYNLYVEDKSGAENHCIWLLFFVKSRQMDRAMNQIIQHHRSSGNIMHSGMCLTFKVVFVVASLSISWRGQKLKRQGWKKCIFHKVSQPLKTPHIYLLSSPSSFSLCFCHSMLYFCTQMRMSPWFLPGPLEIYLADCGCRFPHNAQVSTCLSRLISLWPCICWFAALASLL